MKSFLLPFFLLCGIVYAQTAAEIGFAKEEFRRGVQSYYRGAFNESILLFERAASYVPNEPYLIDWLGKAYYRSGIEEAAIQQWQFALEQGYGGLLLQNKIETVRQRRLSQSGFQENERYIEVGSFSGKTGDTLHFSQPISILPLADGSKWVIAYGTNELLQINVNGVIIARYRGPPAGFDRPMDIAQQKNGNLVLSEFAGDRLSILNKDGRFIKSFGKKGLGNGEFLGPQYIALDEQDTVYVTDFGNARVGVFSANGEALFTFGTKSDFFKGFAAPTGIAASNGIIYVADAAYGTIFCFDTSGNYLSFLVPEGTFLNPEAIRLWQDHLLVADTNRILAVNINTGAYFEAGRTGNAPSRVTCAATDINDNILVADFRTNELVFMSKMSELVGGLFVQIDRVISDKFPNITMDVRIQNRTYKPLVGLTPENFFITENKIPVEDIRFLGSADNNTQCDITLLIDRSTNTASYRDAIQSAVREIAASMGGKGKLTIVSAGQIPVLETSGSSLVGTNFVFSALKSPLTLESSFDLGVRLAANGLINAEVKRSIVFITAGNFSQKALANYGLTDLTSYLNNNGIGFSVVNVTNTALSQEINYIINQTGGKQYYVYRPEGLKTVITDILSKPVGLYRFSYVSKHDTDFGRAFLPIEVEAYLQNLSGRDEMGYFAPLE